MSTKDSDLSPDVTGPEPPRDASAACDRSAHARQLDDLRGFLDLPERRTAEPQAIACSPAMLRVLEQAERYAQSAATVLLTGESGTGKEVVARLIHHASPRRAQPYVRVNCAALPETLLESELFGHERGAFTGAISQRIGRFEWANGGTLLLDEISEIPLALQAKLLRVLEEEEYQRIGSNETRPLNVRIIATSNRRLDHETQKGNFREDLYYRLHVLSLEIPPLRQRREDIPELARYFVQCFGHEGPETVRGIDQQAMNILQGYSWPGNVRQLRNTIWRACIDCTCHVITPPELSGLSESSRDDHQTIPILPLAELERRAITEALARTGGNKSEAARQLGVTARTLWNKLRQYQQQSSQSTGGARRDTPIPPHTARRKAS